MPKVSIEFDVEVAQEIASTINTVVSKIDWVLENTPPRKKGQAEALDERAKMLTKAAGLIEKALNDRALSNVTKMGARSAK